MQKISLKIEMLRRAFTKISPAINPGTIIPVLKNVLFEVRQNNLIMTASDSDISIRHETQIGAEVEFDMLLPYSQMSQIIKLTNREDAEIQMNKKNIVVSVGSDSFEFPNLSAEGFPRIPPPEENAHFILPKEEITYLRKATMTCAKRTDTWAKFVLLGIEEESIDIVGTDVTALYLYRLPTGHISPVQILLSEKVIKAISGNIDIKISWDAKRYSIIDDGITIYCTQSNFKYGAYKAVIPDLQPNVTISRDELLQALIKCNLSANKVIKGIFNADILKLNTEDIDTGFKVNVEVPITYSGEPLEVNFTAELALKIINQAAYKTLDIAAYAGKRCLKITTDEDKNYLSLIYLQK